MSENAERIAKVESAAHTVQEVVQDHEQRLRRLERLIWGIIGAALVFSWVITQTSNIVKAVTSL